MKELIVKQIEIYLQEIKKWSDELISYTEYVPIESNCKDIAIEDTSEILLAKFLNPPQIQENIQKNIYFIQALVNLLS